MNRSKAVLRAVLTAILATAAACCLSACETTGGDPQLTGNTRVELVDWHITGLMVINCPVAWVRVANYNNVPIKDVLIQYNTYDEHGTPLDQATYVIEGEIGPGNIKNFIEQYLGLVNVHSERLSIKLISVKRG
jgi:hypothetical protein